jgi:hypothetical protein
MVGAGSCAREGRGAGRMDWTSLIGPAVVAAVIAGIISVITLLMNRATTLTTHLQRLAFEREQAERKTSADIALAEKKLALDRAFAAWKRRTEFAEEVLGDFYQARDVIESARSPGGFGDEGSTREKEGWETEGDTRLLNSYFRTLERLDKKTEFFANCLPVVTDLSRFSAPRLQSPTMIFGRFAVKSLSRSTCCFKPTDNVNSALCRKTGRPGRPQWAGCIPHRTRSKYA